MYDGEMMIPGEKERRTGVQGEKKRLRDVGLCLTLEVRLQPVTLANYYVIHIALVLQIQLILAYVTFS